MDMKLKTTQPIRRILIKCPECGDKFWLSDPKGVENYEKGIEVICLKCSEIAELFKGEQK